MKKSLIPALLFITMAFVTSSYAQTTIMTQNFSTGALPAGWSRSVDSSGPNLSKGWQFGTTAQLNSAFFPIPSYPDKIAATDNWRKGDSTGNVGADFLITSPLDFTPYANVVIYFDAFYLGQLTPYPDASTASLWGSTNGGVTWDSLFGLQGALTWQHISVDLSLSYANTNGVMLGFKFSDEGISPFNSPYTTPYGFAIGNVSVVAPAQYQAVLASLNIPSMVAATNDQMASAPITGTLQNQGAYSFNSATINWTINGGDVQSENVSIPYVSTTNFASFTLKSTIPVPTPDSFNVVVWVTNPNGQANADTAGTLLSTTVYGLSGLAKRKVLIEEATGEWCGFCPDGAYALDTIQAAHPDILAVSLHDDGGAGASEDTLEITNGESIVNQYITSFPGGLVDRQFYAFNNSVEQPRFGWDSLAVKQLLVTEPVTVGLYNTYDSATRTISATVLAKLYAGLPNNYTLNVYVCEDSVKAWQHNYYSSQYPNGPQDPSSPFYNLPFDITNFPENRVVRAILGGPYGTASVIAATSEVNKEYNKTYTYTVPKGQNPDQMFLVATVEQVDPTTANNRPILNSVKCPLNSFAANSVKATYFSSDTGTANTGDSLTFYRGDSLWYNGGFLVFQLGDTVNINGTIYIINALNDSVVLHPGDNVTVTGPTGAGTTTFPQGPYTQYSYGTIAFVPYTGIAAVNGKESLNVYPNPADRQLNISLTLAQSSDVQITLTDITGQRVNDIESLNMGSGVNNHSLSVANLSPGVYILAVRTAQSSFSNKVVITR